MLHSELPTRQIDGILAEDVCITMMLGKLIRSAMRLKMDTSSRKG